MFTAARDCETGAASSETLPPLVPIETCGITTATAGWSKSVLFLFSSCVVSGGSGIQQFFLQEVGIFGTVKRTCVLGR